MSGLRPRQICSLLLCLFLFSHAHANPQALREAVTKLVFGMVHPERIHRDSLESQILGTDAEKLIVDLLIEKYTLFHVEATERGSVVEAMGSIETFKDLRWSGYFVTEEFQKVLNRMDWEGLFRLLIKRGLIETWSSETGSEIRTERSPKKEFEILNPRLEIFVTPYQLDTDSRKPVFPITYAQARVIEGGRYWDSSSLGRYLLDWVGDQHEGNPIDAIIEPNGRPVGEPHIERPRYHVYAYVLYLLIYDYPIRFPEERLGTMRVRLSREQYIQVQRYDEAGLVEYVRRLRVYGLGIRAQIPNHVFIDPIWEYDNRVCDDTILGLPIPE